MEIRPLTIEEQREIRALFAPEDSRIVEKMVDPDPNRVFDSCFAFLQDHPRQPAEKSATDCTGEPLNDCLDSVFPFQVRQQIQKSVKEVATGIADLRQRETRLRKMENAVAQLRAVVSKMVSATPPETVRDETIETSPASGGGVFDSLFPSQLPLVVS